MMSFIELLLNVLGVPCERYPRSTIHMLLCEEVDRVPDRIKRIFLPILLVSNFLHSSMQACKVLIVFLILMTAIELFRFFV